MTTTGTLPKRISATWSIGMDGTRRATVGSLVLLVTNRRTQGGLGPIVWAVYDPRADGIVADGATYQGSDYSALVRQAMLDCERAAAVVGR